VAEVLHLASTAFGFKGDEKLEACLHNDRDHLTIGSSGDHVSKIQRAVMLLENTSINKSEINAKIYGKSTAAVVFQFKRKRHIINWSYQRKEDDIVGKMTIKAMDDELVRRFPFSPISPSDINIPPDLPIPPPAPGSPTSAHFKNRFLSGISAADGIAGDVLFIQIWDTTNNLAMIYNYFGGGLGLGVPKLPPLSGTLAGPFSEFLTIKPVPVGIFAGPAHWTSGGGGPFTLNILQIFFIAGETSGVQMTVNTGFTVGLGISSTFGFMAPQTDAQPFTGP
jgi:hypothetical protein